MTGRRPTIPDRSVSMAELGAMLKPALPRTEQTRHARRLVRRIEATDGCPLAHRLTPRGPLLVRLSVLERALPHAPGTARALVEAIEELRQEQRKNTNRIRSHGARLFNLERFRDDASEKLARLLAESTPKRAVTEPRNAS